MTEPQHPEDQTTETGAGLTINALGLACPVPVIMLAERIHEVPTGETVEVLSDDPAASTDLPDWCKISSHEFVRAKRRGTGWSFLIRRLH